MTFPLQELAQRIRLASRTIPFASEAGVVASVSPSGFAVEGLSHLLEIGSLVEVDADRGRQLAEVIRLSRSTALCKPYDARVTFRLGSRVLPAREMQFFPDETWKGRIIDALARPVDGRGALALGDVAVKLASPPPPAMRRRLVGTGIRTGIRVVDAFTPICLGQRIGIFAGLALANPPCCPCWHKREPSTT